MTKVVKSTESIINILSSVYRNSQFNPKIEVVLTGQIVWTGAPVEPTFVGTEIMASKYMNDMYTYVYSNRATLPKYDNVMLFTGYDLEGSTIGLARVCSMCSLSSSGSLIMAAINTRNTDAYIASIAIHEMGHNFCLRHDTADVNPACTANRYIMYPSASRSSPATQFSACSYDYYNTAFLPKYNNNPSIQCLENVPGMLPTLPPVTSTNIPTNSPTSTVRPTVSPTTAPTTRPTTSPTTSPTSSPTINPVTPIPTNTPIPTLPADSSGRCGVAFNWKTCRNNMCCSFFGYCNSNGDAWCSRARGCQLNCKS
jgi:hypothetical protein